MPIAVILQIIQALAPLIIEKGPGFVEDITAIFNTPNPTAADWDALKAKYAQPEPPTVH